MSTIEDAIKAADTRELTIPELIELTEKLRLQALYAVDSDTLTDEASDCFMLALSCLEQARLFFQKADRAQTMAIANHQLGR